MEDNIVGQAKKTLSVAQCMSVFDNPDKLSLMLLQGDVNDIDVMGNTLLGMAIYMKRVDVLKILLTAPNIKVNAPDRFGWTPLWTAAYWGRTECLSLLLLVQNIDVNRPGDNGYTPLSIAIKQGHTKCAELIRAVGGKESGTSNHVVQSVPEVIKETPSGEVSCVTVEEEQNSGMELCYKPILSKLFTSFAGVCSREEYSRAVLIFGILSAPLLVLFICYGFVPIMYSFSSPVAYVILSILYMVLVVFPFVRKQAKRFHSFGMSYTLCGHIITIIPILSYIGLLALSIVSIEFLITFALFIVVCNIYFISIIHLRVLFDSSPIEGKLVHTASTRALVKMFKEKSNKSFNEHGRHARRTLKITPAPSMPIVTTKRGGLVDATSVPPKRRFLCIVVIILVLFGSAYCVYRYIQSQSEDHISEEFAQEKLILEANEKNKKEAQDKLKAMGITDYDKAVMEHYDNPEKLQLLITAGGNVNVTDEYGETPLYRAANSGHTECVKLLVSAPSFDGSGWNALSVAVFGNDSKKIKQLIQTGMSVNSEDIYGTTPLFWAAQMGAVECVQQLLSAPGIDVNKAGKYGYTPLYRAANSGHAECVKLLLAAPGIDVNRADEWGRTPLYKAVYEGHTEVVKLLLAAPGIDVNKALEYGETPLYRAAYGGHTEVVKLLLAAPSIDVYKADKDGRTPFITAAYKGHTEVVKLLLAIPGIDVNKTNKYGWTLLSTAAHGGHTEVVKLLLAIPGIDVNKADNSDRTPLYKAAHEGRAEVVKLLLVAPGIDVNKADKSGQTPLYKAAQEGRTEVVKLLLAAPGIDVNKANNIGWTPLGWAVKRGYSEIVKLLKAAGAKK